jgi:hypothetical protein
MIQSAATDRTPIAPANPPAAETPATGLSSGIPIEVSSAGTGTTNDPSATDGGRPPVPPPPRA